MKLSKESCEVPMPDYDALKEILGKTIQGAIVKKNMTDGYPAMSVHLVFNDGTSYEIYSMYPMSFAKGVNHWDMESARKYGIDSRGPMENVLDVTLDDD
jgi:hypothetical protein